jgi:hypothetical protein
MQFPLHVLCALAALAFVSAAAVMGARQPFVTATPGVMTICRAGQDACADRAQTQFQQARNTLTR